MKRLLNFLIPEKFYPPDGALLNPFPAFILKAIEVPSLYRIVVQTYEFFDEFRSTEINGGVTNDTLIIPFNHLYLELNRKYYWRVAAYTREDEPNSISPLYNFTIKLE